ncbi:MAG: cupin domain-containing protein [Gelidibacter sp.]
MAASNKPELSLLDTGSSLKTLQISAMAGMIMPLHHATKETVIVVQEGTALLKMPNAEHVLNKGLSFIIPALVEHTLVVKTDFKAIAIMAADSEIEFI